MTMKQVLQHLRTCELEVADVPASQPANGSLLTQTRCSLISAGTERMLLEFGQANLIPLARSRKRGGQAVRSPCRLFSTSAASIRLLSLTDTPSDAYGITSPFSCPLTLPSPQWGEGGARVVAELIS